MKTLKKVLAVLLTAALLFALTATAFADGTGSITMMDPEFYGSTPIYAYKIFDVEDDGNGILTYTAEDPWMSAIIEAVENGVIGGLQIDETTGIVTKLSNFKASEFAEWAKSHIPDDAIGIPFSEVNGKMTTGDIDAGYYLVDSPHSTVPSSLCNVLDGQEIKINNKQDLPFSKRVYDSESDDWIKESGVQVGDIVDFWICAPVPSTLYEGHEYFYHLISDRLSEGLTLLNDAQHPITVILDDEQEVELTVITDPNATLEGDQIRFVYDGDRLCGFDLSIDCNTIHENGNLEVEIYYSALVNPDAAGVISENFATLDYGNEDGNHHKESMTKHYCSTIVVDKYETGSPESKVPGAKFVLKNADGKFYAVDDDGNVSWEDDQADATEVVTDAEGHAEFPGLADGTYTLVETEAPAGYVQLTDEIEVIVDGSDATNVGLEEPMILLALNKVVRVANTPGTNLPSFGGIGIYGFIGCGIALIALAVVLILVLSRKKQTN